LCAEKYFIFFGQKSKSSPVVFSQMTSMVDNDVFSPIWNKSIFYVHKNKFQVLKIAETKKQKTVLAAVENDFQISS